MLGQGSAPLVSDVIVSASTMLYMYFGEGIVEGTRTVLSVDVCVIVNGTCARHHECAESEYT